MGKNEVIDKLRNANYESGIAEVICDISCCGKVCYPNESILVLLCGYGKDNSVCNVDQIINSKHYTICDGIDIFEEGIVYGIHEAAELDESISEDEVEDNLKNYNWAYINEDVASLAGDGDNQFWQIKEIEI